jgi:hypothetical protein
VEEVIFREDPNQMRHNYTQYVCCEHFKQIFGSWTHREEVMGMQEPLTEAEKTTIAGKPAMEKTGLPVMTGQPFSGNIDVDHLFTYHSMSPAQTERANDIREAARVFAHVILLNTKPSADQSAAIRLLREVQMTAVASIALEK